MKRTSMIALMLVLGLAAVSAQTPSGLRLVQPGDGGGENSPAGLHDLTGLPMTSAGWTDFETMVQTGYEDARVVFVANAGDDSTARVYGVSDVSFDANGMFQAANSPLAFATITAAYEQMRTGYPDIMLLRRSDEWSSVSFATDGIGRLKSGRGITQRHIIASYGTGHRPQLSESFIDARDASYTLVAGLRMYTSDWTTSDRALEITGDANHQLYEDMWFDQHNEDKIEGGTDGIYDIAIRRCLYSHYQAHDGFMYISKITRLLLEENVYYEPFAKYHPDESQHGRHLYMSPSGSVPGGEEYDSIVDATIRGNIFYWEERGTDFRGGGHIENNLFLRSGFLMGGNGGSSNTIQSGNSVANVFMEGKPNTGGGSGTTFRNIDGAEISDNIYTDPTNVTVGMTLINISGDDTVKVAKNQNVHGNIIYGYRAAGQTARGISYASSSGDPLQVENNAIYANDVQYVTGSQDVMALENVSAISEMSYSNNRYFSTDPEADWFSHPSGSLSDLVAYTGETGAEAVQVDYPDPDRTVRTYNVSLGGTATTEQFMEDVMLQSRHNWRPAYTATAVNNYIREGFGKDPLN